MMPAESYLSPLVTIIIPCFQHQAYLSRALRSVQEQSYQNIEVIVVDDGSEPAIEVPQCFSGVQLVRQKNSGLSAARNAGLAIAKGEFVKFLDADDELTPSCIDMQVSSLRGASHAFSCTGFREIHEEDGKSKDIFPAFGAPLPAIAQLNFGPPHIYLFRTKEICEAGGFDVSDRVNGGHEDYDLVFRLLVKQFDVRTVHEIGAVYYKIKGSMSSKLEPMNRTRTLVWLHNTNDAILNGLLADQQTALGFAIGMALILKSAPNNCRSLFKPLISFLSDTFTSMNFNISVTEMNRLRDMLAADSLTASLAHILKTNSNLKLKEHIRPTKFVIDPRFHLKLREKTFSDKVLNKILTRSLLYNHQFIIYGAGEYGRRLLRILNSAGIMPMFIVDQAWQNHKAINGINVNPPDHLSNPQVKMAIIASEGSRGCIRSKIEAIRPDLEIL